MSKSKKKPQKRKGIKLSDAILQYQVKNYTGALTRLKAAELKLGEEQKAKNLQYALTLRLAFADISAHQYDKTIQQLQPLLPNDPIAAVFAGIAHLYLSEYALAIPLLKTAVKTYPSFAFYHLFAEIYHQQDIDYKEFTDYFKDEWVQCSDSQKLYLQIIIYVFNHQLTEAAALVEGLKNQSHFQHLNFQAFKNIFNPSNNQNESLSDKVKPLYRLLLNGFLSDLELAYFKNLDAKTGALSALLDTKSALSSSLQKEIAAQYNEQKVLNETVLGQIMQNLSLEQRPYIAYNQAVNAYHQKDFDVADKGIKHIIVKYADDFALIPESLSLYLNFYQNDEFRMYPNTFWAFVKKWLSVRNNHISVENLDAMGWQIFDIITKHPSSIQSSCQYEPAKIYKDYPSVFALKFTQILFPNTQIAPNLVTDSRLDLFSLPNSEKNKDAFVEKFALFMSVLSPYNNRFSFLDDASVPKSRFIQQIVYYSECFMVAVTKYPVPPQNLIALEAFKTVHKYIQNIINDNTNVLPKGFYERFLNTYKQLLAKFPENEALNVYKRDIDSLEYNEYIIKLKELTKFRSTPTQFTKFLKTLPKDIDYTFIWEHLGKRIEEFHYSSSFTECLANFLEALFVFQKNETASKNEIDDFVEMYKKVAAENDCEHPTLFYAQLIRIILKNKMISKNIAYFFCVQYIGELTLSYEFEPTQYNAVAEFLNWIMANNYPLAYPADKQLFTILRTYLIKINTEKELKGLAKTILNTASYI